MVALPYNGIQVHYGNRDYNLHSCVTDPTLTSSGSLQFAAQCCTKDDNDCVRTTNRRFNDDDCLSGYPAVGKTYAEAYQICADLGYKLCDHTSTNGDGDGVGCPGEGCSYNSHLARKHVK